MFNLLNGQFNCDTPTPWGLYFQDSATPQMEGLVELHDNIMFYLVIILFGVGWIMISIVRNYTSDKSPISHKYLNHGTLIELIWTITPALILILIAFPSFKLLYLMDEVSDPAMFVLREGDRWDLSYQYPDFQDYSYVSPPSLSFMFFVIFISLVDFYFKNKKKRYNGIILTPVCLVENGYIYKGVIDLLSPDMKSTIFLYMYNFNLVKKNIFVWWRWTHWVILSYPYLKK
jgi:heme/copper-type cytochrome/quinol oxidase subunit 2